MLNTKKIVSAVLAVLMAGAMSTSVFAEEITDSAEGLQYSTYAVRPGDSVNYTYIFDVGAGFYVSGTKGKCDSSYTLYSNRAATVTISLMKSSDGINWTTEEYWTETHFTSMPNITTKESMYSLDHDYYYRTHTQVQVLNANGAAIETGSCTSNSVYYP